MTFVKVDLIPNVAKRWHDLQALIEEFEKSDAKCVKMIFSESEYKNPISCYKSLQNAVKKSKRSVKAMLRGNDIYLKKI